MSVRINDVASLWPTTVEIPRVKDPTQDQVEAFIRAGEPALFENVVPQAVQDACSMDNLLANYGDEEIIAHIDFPRESFGAMPPERSMTVADFVDWMNDPSRELPCQAVHLLIDRLELEESFSFHHVHPELSAQQLWLQSTDLAVGLHLHRQAWVGGVWGEKDIVMFHRRDTSKGFEPLDLNPNHVRLDPRKPDFEKHPELRKAVPYLGTLKPGDVLFIPAFMWHALWSVGPSVTAHADFYKSIHVPGEDPFDWPEFTLSLGKWFGPKMVVEIARQAMWYGALQRPIPEKQNAYEMPPWGAYIWRSLVSGHVDETTDEFKRSKA